MAGLRIPGTAGKRIPRTDHDVVVVGGGGSGLAAAIEAAESGARVLVLEAGEKLRGSTGRSVGSIAASCTPDQARLGIEDSPEDHLRDYRTLSGRLADGEDPELVELLIGNVTATLAWLRGMGMEFYGPVGEPPHSAPRLHNILPGSTAYIHHLSRRATQVGVEVRTGVRVTSLIVEGERVVGVRAGQAAFRARRAVVLTTGDFSANPDLKRQWINPRVAGFQPVNPHAQGDAQTMAEAVGGQVLNARLFDVPSMRLSPPPSEGLFGLVQKIPPVKAFTGTIRWSLANLPSQVIRPLMMGFVTTFLSPREVMFTDGGILVDRDGALRSETDENINLSVAALGEQGGFLIGDRRLFEKYDREPNHVATAPGVAHAYMSDFRRARKDVYAEADTLDGLATRLGISPTALAAAVEEGNRRKTAHGRPTLGTGPWFALGPLHAFLLQTNGGLAVNRDLRVIRADGTAVDGLFAAGNAGQGGLALFGHGHHLGWAFTSGRLAGRGAAQHPQASSTTRSPGPPSEPLSHPSQTHQEENR